MAKKNQINSFKSAKAAVENGTADKATADVVKLVEETDMDALMAEMLAYLEEQGVATEADRKFVASRKAR
jgi:hypothetical protein